MDSQLQMLAAEQFGMTMAGLIAIMGIFDGLIRRRVYFQFVALAESLTGLGAKVIGGCSVVLGLGIVFVLVTMYVPTLAHFCQGSLDCYVSAPVRGLFFAWPVTAVYLMMLIFFVGWVRRRRLDIHFVQFVPPSVAPTGASIYALIQERLAEAHEPQLKKEQIDHLRDQVDRLIPLLLLQSSKVVMDGQLVNAERVAKVILGMPEYGGKGKRTEIAVAAIVEAYVRALNENSRRHGLKRLQRRGVGT